MNKGLAFIETCCEQGHNFRVKATYVGQTATCPICYSAVCVASPDGPTPHPSASDTVDKLAEARDTSQELPGANAGTRGSEIGRFRILEVLGEGGFGTVYRAHDPQLDRQIALKIPRWGTFSSDRDTEKFLREAKACAQLHHPNIVPIHDAGRIEATCYIASAYIQGRTLRARLSETDRLTTPQVVKLIADLAMALHYAHAKGVIHRDVKPDNVLLDGDGTPYLTDFGLARRLSGDVFKTREGAILGTPAYMSPEQASGKGSSADGRTDQWSLGVMLYEMLVGERPFQGNEVQVMYAIRDLDVKPLRQIDPRIPKDLEIICLKCLAKEPEHRYADCQQLAEDLRRWLRDEPILARRTGIGERLYRWSRRNPTSAKLVGCIVAGALSGAVTVAVLLIDTMRARVKAEESEKRATLALRKFEAEASKRESAQLSLQDASRREKELNEKIEKADVQLEARKKELNQTNSQLAAASRDLTEKQKRVENFEQELKKSRDELTVAGRGKADAEARLRDEMYVNEGSRYLRDVSAAQQQWILGNRGETEKLLNQCPVSLRSWEWHHLAGQLKNSRNAAALLEVQPGGFYRDLFLPKTYLKAPELRKYQETLNQLNGVVVSESRDGRYAVVGHRPPNAKNQSLLEQYGCYPYELWRLSTAEKVNEGWLAYVQLAPNSSYMATVEPEFVAIPRDRPTDPEGTRVNATVKLWDLQTGVSRELLNVAMDQFLNRVGPQNPTVFAAANRRHRAPNSPPPVWAKLAFNDTGSRLACYLSLSSRLYCFELGYGKEHWDQIMSEKPACGTAIGDTLQFVDGRLLVLSDRSIQFYDVDTGKVGKQIPLASDQILPGSVTFSENFRHFLAGNEIWDVELGRRLGAISLFEPGPQRRKNFAGLRLMTSPDLSWVSIRDVDGAVRAWEGLNKKLTMQINDDIGIQGVALDPSSQFVGIASGSRILVWRVGGASSPDKLVGHPTQVIDMRFAPLQKRMASLSSDGTIIIWDTETWRRERPPFVRPGATTISFRGNGKLLAVGFDSGDVHWLDPLSGESLRHIEEAHKQAVRATEYSPIYPSGSSWFVSVAEDRLVKVWDDLSGFPEHETQLLHDGAVTLTSFSPVEPQVATSGDDGTIRIWDCEKAVMIRQLPEATRDIRSIAYSPDGNRILALSSSGIKIWDPKNGNKVLEITELPPNARFMDLNALGTALVVANEKGLIQLWMNQEQVGGGK